ncbi:MAG TPA: adenylate/guanylate cyclase domain-containing protein, partial [Acidimicrobiia bacterium]|nr:adenylate/guanylate cyclase domain-containing protein [Acidimicrobiia bacterium]
MDCPACGTHAPEAARFCPACGHALATATDQRRVVTVLFADLVGFTTLSEARDPERLKNLVDDCFECLAADVTAYGGKVDKIIGDALVALFGAPVAHEDDAERAVRAALQMQRTIAGFAADSGVEVRMRVGVNTGEVLVGGLRAGDDYTAMGDVVNVASRLQTVANPGEVVVGPETFSATQLVVRYSDLGGIEVKGRAEAVEAWRAEEALAPPGYRPRRVRTPLVGRDAEMGILRHVLQTAAERARPHMVLLAGEAGIGKSRLGEEIAMTANVEHDAAIYVGRCVPYGEANPWWPISEILRQALAIDIADSLEEARDKAVKGVHLATRETGAEAERIVEGLIYLMGFEGSFQEVDPSRAVEEAIAALAAVIEGIAARHLVVLFMADLHWADQVVLDLIDNLLDRVRGQRVVLVATARPELQERWSPEPGRYNAVSLHLDPLTPVATTQLVRALLQQDVPEELAAVLRDRSGGNPFFVEELVALLAEAGVLDGSDVDLAAIPTELRDLPATLRGLVAARLDGISMRERELLEDAAVVGRVGSVAALVGLGQARDEKDVAGLIDELVTRDILVVSDGRFEFKSDLVREVAYETLTKSSRARRHGVLAGWLAKRAHQTGREDEQVEAIAHHYAVAAGLADELGTLSGVEGDVRANALEWLERAAERMLERESNLAAEQFFDEAVGLLGADEDDRRRRLLLGRAQSRCGRHDLPGARADVEEVLEKAEAAHDSAQQVRALTILGEVEQKAGDMEGALATLERAMALANESGDRAALAAALRQWGMANLFMGELARAESAIDEAREAFHELGDRRGEAWALQNLAWIAFSRGEIDVADDRLTRSAAMFEEISDWGGRSWAWGLLGFVRLAQGRLEEAGALADEVIDEARKAGDRWAQGMTLVLQSAVSLWLGKTTTALEAGREARKLFELIDDDYGRGL